MLDCIPSDWTSVTADIYCSSVRDGTHDSPKFYEEGHPLVTSKNIKGGILDLRTAGLISTSDFEEVNRRSKVDQWDVLYSMIGTVGEICLIEEAEPYYAIKNVGLFKTKSEEDGRWLAYWLQTPHAKQLIYERLRGASQQYIPLGELRKLLIPLPHDNNTRKNIIHVMTAYDDLVSANLRRIQLLEESARLLYREWFVLLRFPGNETVPVVDGVPEGWERKPVSEMIDANPKTPFPKDVSRPFVGMEALSEDSMIIDVSDARPISGGAKFRNGDTLLARITPCLENGKTGFVQFLEDDEAAASGSTEFIVLRSRTVNPYWIYCLARSDSFREHAINSMAGSDGRQRVNPKCFDKYLTLRPPSDVLQAFEDNVSGMFAQVQSLTEYNKALRQARDMLLPKLMSGALDVSRIAVPKEVEV